MKIASIYLSKKYFAEKLGIKESQFVFGDVEGNSNEIEFKLFIDDNAEVETATSLSEGHNHWDIQRQSFDTIEGARK